MKHGAHLGEGGGRPHHGDKPRLFFKAFAEADEENVDELPVVDGVPKLAEFVHDGLETLTVDTDLTIALDGVAELGVEGVDAGVDVVLEELTESHPKGGGVGGVAEDEVEDFRGDALINPLDDGEIVLDPSRIEGSGN